MNTVVSSAQRLVRVWDLPTRVFHWGLVASVVGAFVTAELGGDLMAWHFRCGYVVLTLLAFRLIWGFAGTHYARFASFPPNPAAALAYLRAGQTNGPGHNPLGAFSVYLLLAIFLLQAVTGLFANDAIMWDGPLRHLVSDDTSETLSRIHRANEIVMYAVIGLHVAALLFYALFKGQRLIPAMITGDKLVNAADDAPQAKDGTAKRLLAAAIVAVCAAAVAAIVLLL